MNKPILIHYNNTNAATSITNQISFEIKSDNLDLDIIEFLDTQIFIKEFDVVVIKDSLSNNYLEFYGLLLAHHIRLSDNKKVKYLPIVIISDLNMYQLSKLTSLSNICHTEGTYLVDNKLTKIDNILKKDLKGLSIDRFNDSFLNLIDIQPPANYDSKHSIANEWSIFRWSKFLEIINDGNINDTVKHISSMLYFKYLLNRNDISISSPKKIKPTKGDGRILYIDDEWEKGWGTIFYNLTEAKNNKISIKYDLEIDYKEKSRDEIIEKCMIEVENYNPDLVILDLRLCDKDFNVGKDIDSMTGIQLINKIQNINPGIQIIIWSATGDSQILDYINTKPKYDILGFFKKEHPEDRMINIEQNITNISNKIKKGLKNKYLKEIHENRNLALSILSDKMFSQYEIQKNDYEDSLKLLLRNMGYVFDILSSNIPNKYNYAMVSIATSLETIVKIFFLGEKDNYLVFWDGEETRLDKKSSLENKINHILRHKLGDKSDIKLSLMIKRRNDYMHSNDAYMDVTKENIKEWFKTLLNILEIINNPPIKNKQ